MTARYIRPSPDQPTKSSRLLGAALMRNRDRERGEVSALLSNFHCAIFQDRHP
jgi:hypothetical protein